MFFFIWDGEVVDFTFEKFEFFENFFNKKMENSFISRTDKFVYDGKFLFNTKNYNIKDNEFVVTNNGGINVIMMIDALNLERKQFCPDFSCDSEAEFLYHVWNNFCTFMKNKDLALKKFKEIEENDILRNRVGLNPESPVFIPTTTPPSPLMKKTYSSDMPHLIYNPNLSQQYDSGNKLSRVYNSNENLSQQYHELYPPLTLTPPPGLGINFK